MGRLAKQDESYRPHASHLSPAGLSIPTEPASAHVQSLADQSGFGVVDDNDANGALAKSTLEDEGHRAVLA